jgi:hypothetical protein
MGKSRRRRKPHQRRKLPEVEIVDANDVPVGNVTHYEVLSGTNNRVF